MTDVPTQEQLLESLAQGVQVVTFKKKDGDERVMTCTTQTELIPEASRPKEKPTPKNGLVTVWDVTAQGWRSFYHERVTNVDKVTA